MAITRKRLIAGNWKMYKTRAEAQTFASALARLWPPTDREAVGQLPEAVVCAPFTALPDLGVALAKAEVKLGAQNVHAKPEGAYTGEVSVAMLQELACAYVIIGHSERRAYDHETSTQVAAKATVLLTAGIAPIICVGETLAEREAGRTAQVIAEQLAPVLEALAIYDATPGALTATHAVLAYEPIWAIGTGRSSSSADAQEVIGSIRAMLAVKLGETRAQAIRLLYGGSVKPDNIAAYLGEPDIDGALVGGASLEPSS
ncbi:MAG: triose-phosphate isomerase, partial [Firmicutes bacterium]|nr:triose-phosphate isomerase [Bacillota bacterium]